MTNDLGTGATTRTVPQLLALTFGVVYTLVGIAGFFVADTFIDTKDDALLGIFAVNHLHNIAHLIFGVLGIVLSRTLSGARTYGWVLAVAFGVLFLFGLFVSPGDAANILALNSADDVLHLVTALVGVAIATIPVDRTRRGAL